MPTEAHPLPASDAWVARIAAGAMHAAARLNGAGLVLAMVNLLLAGYFAPASLVYMILGLVAAVVGAAELWLLVRVELDRRLFDAMAESGDAAEFDALDQALSVFGWLAPGREGRSLAERSRGALRFLKLAGALTFAQLVLALLLLLLK
ncbi:hypothetical protein [Cupriavidus pinatubonensis]|uniref:Transmembrane protein n=1 Tax=Cupriavidus pinatubonensis TaxID=248026 RepID=A0ABM8X622_9BURK|nr:hypothetical protein [Cupriavidus pinatubonensis]CAG9175402.1 hypothetical protein LMG23994_03091 [Cupriavidus pinatubonensis]